MNPNLRWHFPLTSNSLSLPTLTHTHTHTQTNEQTSFSYSLTHTTSTQINLFKTLVCFVLSVTFVCFVFWRYKKKSIFYYLDKQTIPSVLSIPSHSHQCTLTSYRTYLHTLIQPLRKFLDFFHCFVLAVFFLSIIWLCFWFETDKYWPPFLNNNSSEKKSNKN